jgi:sulfatase maturation enzyme AslB (radical SAM superfamily)
MDLTPYKSCLALSNSIFVANEEKPYRPCCWFKTYIDATDVTDYKNQLAEMDLEYNCDYCIQQDKGGTYSYRQQFTKVDELIITASFDNICNLKCITCTPNNSTQILAERFKHEDKVDRAYTKKYFTEVVAKQAPKKIDFIKTTLANSTFNNLRFDILGGEPLINPAIFEFIDWLAEQPYAKQTTLNITTNGTTYTDKLIKYIDSFKTVGVQLSIDGVEDDFEYLRFGSTFENLEKVCDLFHALTEKYENFHMGCHYTLSWMNCLQFDEFFNWIQTKYPNVSDIYVSKLQTPTHYSIELLTLEMRTKVYNEVTKHLQTPINDIYKKTLFLYKEHMLTTAYDEFDVNLFEHGTATLHIADARRGNDHRKIIKKFVNFLNLHEIHPLLHYVNAV